MLCHETDARLRYERYMRTSSVHSHILVVTTGGTIDALYDPAQGTPYHVPLPETTGGSAVPEAMAMMRIDRGCSFYRLAMKDSKAITVDEMDAILHIAEAGEYDKVLIVSGTDRMPDIAKHIEMRRAERGPDDALAKKRFVLTGAMGPLRNAQGEFRDPKEIRFKNDGWDNLQRAVKDLQRASFPPGAYVRMGRKLWPANEVEKVVHTEGQGPDAVVTHSEFQGRTVGEVRRDNAKG